MSNYDQQQQKPKTYGNIKVPFFDYRTVTGFGFKQQLGKRSESVFVKFHVVHSSR